MPEPCKPIRSEPYMVVRVPRRIGAIDEEYICRAQIFRK